MNGSRPAPRSVAGARALLAGASLLWAAATPPARSAEAFQAGAAQVDITPPPGLEMYGFFNRITEHRLASGTLDPLYARALVLQAGDRRLALITLDLGRTFNEAWLERLRAAVRDDSR